MITAAQTRQVSFATTRFAGAYDRAAVDHLLDEVARTLDALERGRTVGPGGAALLLPRDVRTATLPSSGTHEGYLSTDVDAFRTQVVATLEEYVRRFSAGTAPVAAPTAGPAGSRARGPAAGAGHPTSARGPGSASTISPAPASTLPAGPAGPMGSGGAGSPGASGGSGRPGGSGAPDRAAPTPVDLTHAPPGLGTYDVLVQVQQARSTLFGAARDVLVVRRPDGSELQVTGVEVVPGAAVVHVR